MKRQIFAISGGGFSNEENSPLDQYLLALVPKEAVNICFIPTASQDAAGYIEKFHKAFPHAHTSHITIEQMQKHDMTRFLLQQDIVYVGGGATKQMITIWQESQFDQALRTAYEAGVILAGISAGAMCWFEKGYSETNGEKYEEFGCLSLLQGTFCPHYNEPKRKNEFDVWIKNYPNIRAYTIPDFEALHFVDEQLAKHVKPFVIS